MSYVSWRSTHNNEEKYMDLANDGKLELFPAFKDSSFSEELATITNAVVDSVLKNPVVSLPAFLSVFCEYLHETYGLSPADCEILLLAGVQILLKHVADGAAAAAKTIIEQDEEDEYEAD